jgi:transcriptional regulator with XRE-family HTH domain
MGIVICSARLRLELARRGWGHRDLARAAGISPPTVSAAIAGRPVAPRTLKRIAEALATVAPVDGVDQLLAV